MAGGAWNRTKGADARKNCALESPTRDAGRTALSFARTRASGNFGQARRSLRGRPNECPEKINRAGAGNLERTGQTARRINGWVHSNGQTIEVNRRYLLDILHEFGLTILIMKISLGTDHAGFRYKERVRELLGNLGHEVKDFGTFNEEP